VPNEAAARRQDDALAGAGSLYLCDVLEAKQKNRDPWWRWLGRFYTFWKEELGHDWRDLDEEFYNKLKKL